MTADYRSHTTPRFLPGLESSKGFAADAKKKKPFQPPIGIPAYRFRVTMTTVIASKVDKAIMGEVETITMTIVIAIATGNPVTIFVTIAIVTVSTVPITANSTSREARRARKI